MSKLESETNSELSLPEVCKKITDEMLSLGTNPLENRLLWTHLQNLNPEQITSLLDKLRPFQEWDKLHKELNSDSFDIFLFHPGIVVRIDQFITWIKKESIRVENNLFEIVQKFSDHIGESVVYRFLWLKDVPDFSETNLLSPAYQENTNPDQILYNLLDPTISWTDRTRLSTFKADVMARVTDLRGELQSFTMSVSNFKEVAVSVGWHENKNNLTLQPVLLTFKIPNLLMYGELALIHDSRAPQSITISNQTFSNPGLELFVPFIISKDRIIESHVVNTTPPKWRDEF